MTYSDEEIEGIIFACEERASFGETDAGVGGAWDHAARALRQLLSEVRKLREELEPCPHEEVEEAGAIWWKCCQCGAYIERKSRSQEPAND